jgi:hypothetical protein
MPTLSAARNMATLLLIFTSLASSAQNITTPRTPSPAATVSQTIGISTVTVNYSRPSVKGREVWGTLVPYGWNKQAFGAGNEAPWRAGANENTVLRLSHPARVEGHMVPAGDYGLFFIINMTIPERLFCRRIAELNQYGYQLLNDGQSDKGL